MRQLLAYLAGARGHFTTAGTPEQIAALIEDWFNDGAADGFNLMPPLLPSMLDVFVAEVIPLLQKRGLFRTAYDGRTLREHFGLARPVRPGPNLLPGGNSGEEKACSATSPSAATTSARPRASTKACSTRSAWSATPTIPTPPVTGRQAGGRSSGSSARSTRRPPPSATASRSAWEAANRAAVDAAYKAGMAAGGKDEGAPGIRAHYHPNYYGAYLRDPDGNKVCIVCHKPAS